MELRWNAPAECPDRNAVLETVQQHAVAFEEPPRPIRVRASVRAMGDGYALHLIIEGEGGESEHDLDSASCEVLANAAAFMAAVAMDPVAKAEEESRELKEAVPAPADTPADPSPARLAGFVAASGGVQLTQLAPVSPLISLEGGIRLRWVRVGLVGAYVASVSRDLANTGGQGRRTLQQWIVGARSCALPRVRRVEFPVCLGAAGGQIHGRTEGISSPARDTQAVFLGTIGAGVMWFPLPRLGFGLEAGMWINIADARFAVGGLDDLFRVPRVSGTAQAVLEVRLGPGARSRGAS